MSFVSYFLGACAGLMAIPVTVFFVEIIAAVLLSARNTGHDLRTTVRQRVAVLVPAHNEGNGVRPTIDDIKAQLLTGDRLLVVADNCVDETAAIAAAAGAEVIARNDPKQTGKGYALDFGLKHLSLDPPAIVIMVDADCRLSEGAVDQLARACAITLRPVQALYRMSMPDGSLINYRVAEFSWRVKNWLRPLGLKVLNLPCQLMGTGMAFPWELVRSVNLATGSIVEDLKLGLDMAEMGSAALFYPSVDVHSHFPLSAAGAQSQRERWEQGHIGMILTTVPRLIYRAIANRNLNLLALTFDLMVPPLSLLLVLVSGLFFVTASSVLLGFSPIGLFINTASLAALLVAVFLSWMKCGRDIIPVNSIILMSSYLFAKLPFYRRLMSDRTAPKWIKTDRGNPQVAPTSPVALPTPPIAKQALDP